MAKSRNKKRYTVADRAAYHRARSSNANISENKKLYSRNWLDGFSDPHAKSNYPAVCSEIQRKKGQMSKEYSVSLFGYKNGLKAKLAKK